MSTKKRILIAPLDWGLGHATRCIPIIKELILRGDEVMLAAEKNIAELLKKEFPELKIIFLRGYRIHYSSTLPLPVSLLLQTPKIFRRIFSEHQQLKQLIHKYHIDAVISDNRYGLWNKNIPTVFITHQVMIKCPRPMKFLEPLLYRIHKFFINRYGECWIPDDEKKLSGDFSHRFPLPSNARFIGTLSRWKGEINIFQKKKYDLVAIVSGPEPHRTSFEKLLTREIDKSNMTGLIVRGKPGEQNEKQNRGKLQVVSHLEGKKLFEAVVSSDVVLCRAGYSGIMDLVAAGKDAVLIPTPGQTEQSYLADYLKEKKIFFSVSQKHFRLEDSITESKKYSVKNFPEQADYLPQHIDAWRKKINAL